MTVGADPAFERARPRLEAVAYGMLGEVGEAEDVVQDAWLRWQRTDTADVREPEAYLVTVTTRLALDRLRAARTRRETYVGPWLPEPRALEPAAHDPAEVVLEAETLSLALLHAMERLNPVERAVLLLRDVFDLDYDEVSDAVGRTPSTCRQIARRAREHAGEPRTRFPVADREAARLAEAFAAAVDAGSVQALTALLAEDAVLWSDGGGVVKAARKPVHGAARIANFLATLRTKLAPPGTRIAPMRVNGGPGIRTDTPDGLVSVVALDVADGRVVALRAVSTPAKLARLGSPSWPRARPRMDPGAAGHPSGMSIKRIATVWLPVTDMDRSVGFYRDTLGLEVSQHEDEWSEVMAGDVRIGLNGRDEEEPGGGGGVIAFHAEPDIESAVSELEGQGVEFSGGVSEHPWGKVATFHDPDGTELQLYEPPA